MWGGVVCGGNRVLYLKEGVRGFFLVVENLPPPRGFERGEKKGWRMKWISLLVPLWAVGALWGHDFVVNMRQKAKKWKSCGDFDFMRLSGLLVPLGALRGVLNGFWWFWWVDVQRKRIKPAFL